MTNNNQIKVFQNYLPMSGGNLINETSLRLREVRFLSCENPSGSLQKKKSNEMFVLTTINQN